MRQLAVPRCKQATEGWRLSGRPAAANTPRPKTAYPASESCRVRRLAACKRLLLGGCHALHIGSFSLGLAERSADQERTTRWQPQPLRVVFLQGRRHLTATSALV